MYNNNVIVDNEHNCLPHELFRKIIAETFWNGEIEAELREKNRVDYNFMSARCREELMMKIDVMMSANLEV